MNNPDAETTSSMATELLQQCKSTFQVLSLCCLNTNATVKILSSVRQCQSLASKSQTLCTDASTTSRDLVGLCLTTGERFGALQGPAGPQLFSKIGDLMESYGEIVQAVDDCQAMKEQAAHVADQSTTMMTSLDKAIASVPTTLREEIEEDMMEERENNSREETVTERTLLLGSQSTLPGNEDDDDDEETSDLLALLENVDVDIADLENSASKTRGGGLDIFTASSLGRQIFAETAQKGEFCDTLFSKMKDLCGSIQNVSRGVLTEDADCLTKFRAVVGGITGLLRCHKLLSVLSRAAQAAVRMVEAIAKLIQETWGKVKDFLEQFSAAKKIGKFMGKVNGAFKSGKIPTGAFNNFMKKSAGTSRGFLLG